MELNTLPQRIKDDAMDYKLFGLWAVEIPVNPDCWIDND